MSGKTIYLGAGVQKGGKIENETKGRQEQEMDTLINLFEISRTFTGTRLVSRWGPTRD